MKKVLLLLALVVIAADLCPAQQPPLPTQIPSNRRLITAPQPGVPGAPVDPSSFDLSRNYRLTITFKIADKPGKEAMLLTASREVRANVVSDIDGEIRISGEVNGELSEREDGRLRFSYRLSASIPIKVETREPRPPLPSQQPAPVRPPSMSIQYANEGASGVLIAEPGKTYEVFRSGDRVYSVSISPEAPGNPKSE